MRGQIQFSLNWILVVVGGVFFLLLFIAIARNVMETGEEQQQVSSFTQVMRTIENAKSSPGTQVRASFSNLQTTCDNSYSVQLAGQQRSIPEHTLFSPPLLDGSLTIRSEELYLGMPITTLTYLLPDNRPVYVIGTVDVNLRGFLDAEVVSEASDVPQDAILVSDGEVAQEDRPRFFINIPDNAEQGTVNFFVNGENAGESKYANKELLLAAIASTNTERYECGLGVAEKKMHFLAELNKERAEILDDEESNPSCNSAYDSTITALTNLKTKSLTDVSDLESITRDLNRANNILLANSCPTI